MQTNGYGKHATDCNKKEELEDGVVAGRGDHEGLSVNKIRKSNKF